MADPVKTPIEPSLVQRIVQGWRYVVRGSEQAWFGPQNPINPVADADSQQTRGRIFNYPAAYNVNTTPKRGEGVTFADLRGLADNYDLVRLCIETRKDQMASLEWDFGFRDKKKRGEDDRIVLLREFFRYPDKQNDWETWLRMILEDMLVIDATTLYPRLTRGGDIYGFDPLDGATINRVLDGYGRTPQVPDPAYQQILQGMPAVDYTQEELIYRPRNLRTNKVYGFSPVEQIITTVNIAMRRQIHQLSYFTEGNIPNSIFSVPETWNPDDIRQFQEWWDSLVTGKTKNYGRFVPNGVNVIDTKQAAFGKDDSVMNEWLARVVCYCFNVSPTQLTVSNNRATAATQKDLAEDDGLKPTKQWVKNLIDFIVHRYFGFTDLEFVYQPPQIVDPTIKANVTKVYVDMGAIDPEEVREELGYEPFTDEQRERMKAAKQVSLPFGMDAGAEAEGTSPPADAGGKSTQAGGDKPVAGGGEGKNVDDVGKVSGPVIGKLEVHLGDTLIEQPPMTINATFADGRKQTLRADPE